MMSMAADAATEYASGKSKHGVHGSTKPPITSYEEEDKEDNVGSMRVLSKPSTLMMMNKDHGNSGNNQFSMSGKGGNNMKVGNNLIGAKAAGGISSNSGQSSAIQGQSQSASVGGPNLGDSSSSNHQQHLR